MNVGYIPCFFYASRKSTLVGKTQLVMRLGNVKNVQNFLEILRICATCLQWLTHPQSSSERKGWGECWGVHNEMAGLHTSLFPIIVTSVTASQELCQLHGLQIFLSCSQFVFSTLYPEARQAKNYVHFPHSETVLLPFPKR